MNPGPITSQCFPPEYGSEYRVVTIDFKTKREIDPVYEGASEDKANLAFGNSKKELELARSVDGEYEPTIIQLWENGEKIQELEIA
jgi:hypothetical protein